MARVRYRRGGVAAKLVAHDDGLHRGVADVIDPAAAAGHQGVARTADGQVVINGVALEPRRGGRPYKDAAAQSLHSLAGHVVVDHVALDRGLSALYGDAAAVPGRVTGAVVADLVLLHHGIRVAEHDAAALAPGRLVGYVVGDQVAPDRGR